MIDKRLTLVAAFALNVLFTPLAAEAQPAGQAPARIGFIGNSGPKTGGASVEAFRQGLRDLGWIEGQKVIIEYRWAEGNVDRFPVLGLMIPQSLLIRADQLIE